MSDQPEKKDSVWAGLLLLGGTALGLLAWRKATRKKEFNPFDHTSVEREIERVRREYVNSGPDPIPDLDEDGNRALRQMKAYVGDTSHDGNEKFMSALESIERQTAKDMRRLRK